MNTHRRGEHGAILIWSTFAIVMLAVLLAVVVNVGHVTSVRGELQNAVDAGALAAARQLSGRAVDLPLADAAGVQQVATHGTGRFGVVASEVRFGTWVPPGRPCDARDRAVPLDRRDGYSTDGYHFCEVTGNDESAAFRVNATYVRAGRSDTDPGGGAVPMLFGPLLSRSTAPVAASAIAVSGGNCGGDCVVPVPVVIGVGCLTDSPGGGGGLACDTEGGQDSAGPLFTIGLSPTPVRSGGWSVLSSTAPSDSQLCSFLKNGGVGCLRVGTEVEMVDVGQGNKFNGGCKAPGAGTQKNVCDWFKLFVGQDIDVPVVSLSGSLGEACPSTYTGRAWLVGYATHRVLAVNCSASTQQPDCVEEPGANACANASSPCGIYASGKCVLTRLVCNHLDGKSTGCAWTGTSPLRPVLVR